MENQELTFGQKAVGISFNPSQDPSVKLLKELFAAAIDAMDLMRGNTTNPKKKRMLSIAITEAQTAQMWAVKAVTWQE